MSTTAECLTCGWDEEAPGVRDAARLVGEHRCPGKPYPLRTPPPAGARGAGKQWPAKDARPWRDVVEDVDWMASTGETRAGICARLGMDRGSILRVYRRHGLPLPAVLTGPEEAAA